MPSLHLHKYGYKSDSIRNIHLIKCALCGAFLIRPQHTQITFAYTVGDKFIESNEPANLNLQYFDRISFKTLD